MKPFTLSVANGLTSVPSPLKLMPSTMAFGFATPPTMLNPCVANRYEPRSVWFIDIVGYSKLLIDDLSRLGNHRAGWYGRPSRSDAAARSSSSPKISGAAYSKRFKPVRLLFKPRSGGGGAAGADEVAAGIENFDVRGCCKIIAAGSEDQSSGNLAHASRVLVSASRRNSLSF